LWGIQNRQFFGPDFGMKVSQGIVELPSQIGLKEQTLRQFDEYFQGGKGDIFLLFAGMLSSQGFFQLNINSLSIMF
jgi:hypothetical protein